MSEVRLQKIMAQAGIASRRKSEELIEQGLVTVDGKIAKLGDKADPFEVEIRVEGKPLPKRERYRYIMLHKPRGVLSTVKRQDQVPDRPTVVEMVNIEERVYPVGRLDLNSEGLILMTNDGDLTNRITHPRYGHEKTYKIQVAGEISDAKLQSWRKGHITLEDGFKPAPCVIKVLERTRRHTWLRVVLREGHKRQLRDIGDKLDHPVMRLIRTHVGSVALGDLLPGHWRELTSAEIEALKGGASSSNDDSDTKKPRAKRGSFKPARGKSSAKGRSSKYAKKPPPKRD